MPDTPDDRPLRFLSDEQFAYWSTMPGFLLPSAAERLFLAARDVRQDGAIVELGSFAGKSLVCLARGMSSRSTSTGTTLAAIDLCFHEKWAEAIEVFGLADLVTPLERGSLDVANDWSAPISLLYIDADHGFGHARADFVAWEPFVLSDGIIALDDTAGFYPGCSLQIQMAMADGRFELLDDVGGVTFLRKKAPLFEGIGQYPVRRNSAFATVAAASAWSGAMDPELRLPNPMRFVLPDNMLRERLQATLHSLQELESNLEIEVREEVLPTVAYLEAVVHLHVGAHDECLRTMGPLAQESQRLFFHYDLEVAPVARLRQAQAFDVAGRRSDAMRVYGELRSSCPVEAVRIEADRGVRQPFTLQKPTAGHLLRDYVLDSPLGQYRRLRPRTKVT
jgi:predicted O-methyltransferase YrrM